MMEKKKSIAEIVKDFNPYIWIKYIYKYMFSKCGILAGTVVNM